MCQLANYTMSPLQERIKRADETYFFYVVQAYDKFGGKSFAFLRWNQLSFRLVKKYKWYFEYRAALLKVANPKAYIEIRSGHATPDGLRMGHTLKNRIRAKKAKITEFKNKVEKTRKAWNSLFPIEDDPKYYLVVNKLERLKNDLIEAKQDFAEFLEKNPHLRNDLIIKAA